MSPEHGKGTEPRKKSTPVISNLKTIIQEGCAFKSSSLNIKSGELLLHVRMENNLQLTNFVQCSHHNTWYCKFRDQCRYQHFSTVCNKSVCKDKKCQNRHPKTCRNGESCRFHALKACAYNHSIETVIQRKESKNIPEIESLQKEIKSLQDNILQLKNLVQNKRTTA